MLQGVRGDIRPYTAPTAPRLLRLRRDRLCSPNLKTLPGPLEIVTLLCALPQQEMMELVVVITATLKHVQNTNHLQFAPSVSQVMIIRINAQLFTGRMLLAAAGPANRVSLSEQLGFMVVPNMIPAVIPVALRVNTQ